MADGYVPVLSVSATTDADALEAFLTGLTDLSRQTGIAISGSPELFIMEAEDHAFAYTADAESRLILN